MSANTVAETPLPKAAPPRRRVWVYTFIGLLVVIAFGYFSLNSSRDNAANNDFYRILYEASNKFNENFSQLDKMHVNGESVNSIRTQLPSYQRIHRSTKLEQEPTKDFKYYLVGQKIEIGRHITHENETDKPIISEAKLQITDILPSPKQGFSQYLFTDSAGKVLAKIADEKTISIDNLDSISREIEKNKRRFQLNLNESQSSGNEQSKPQLPSYSSYVDMELSHKEFRIFIFPFSLDTPLINQNTDSKDAASKDTTTINTLYLVGLLPKHKLPTEGSEHWNLSLLLVTLVSLMFMWTLLRLYLLPNNQSITPLYRYFTLVSSYAFFIVLIALVLAFMQKTTLQASKDSAAAVYAQHLSSKLENNLYCTFKGLTEYRPFYHNLLAELDDLEAVNVLNRAEPNNDPPAADGFSQMVKNSFASIISLPCKETSLSNAGKLPGYAFTSSKAYPITYNRLNANGKEKPHTDIELDQSAEQIMLQAYQKNISGTHMLGFMAGNLDLKVGSTGTIESYVSQGKKSYLPANILTVFAINGDGNITLPSIYYQEYNAPPQVLNLTHRDYYKKVRDYRGWQPELCLTTEDKKNPQCTTFNNVYIQRVLNMSDGTRGTTISMPMYDPKESKKPKGELVNIPVDRLSFTLGADVILPSLSLAAPAPNDFTYMVIDRNSGDVLFHSDESRTLVENLFYASNGKSNLSQWIKAGLDHYPKLSKKIIEGNYHGQSGRFTLIPAPLDAWAIVVFYPNDSLDDLMVNQFLLISMSFAIALLALVVLLMVCRKYFRTNALKDKLFIPEKINGRVIFMISSIILSAIYSLYYIGLLFDKVEVWQQPTFSFSLGLPSIGILIILFILFRIYKNHFSAIGLNQYIKGLIPLFTIVILLSIAHLTYLHKVAEIPIRALEFHYQQVHCNSSNYEKQESNKMALSRYPNSITQQRIDPDQLLPQASKLPEILDVDYDCTKHSSQVEPDDYLNLSSLMDATYLWQWINATMRSSNSPMTQPLAIQNKELNIALYPVVVCALLILAGILAWLLFVRRTLWRRLYCSDRFLQHIERLTQSKCELEPDKHHTQLIIECDRVKLNGIGLALLLRTAVMNENKPAELKANNLLTGFDTLYQLSPLLQKFGAHNSALPNLKLNVKENSNNKKLDVKIWDIETCLAQAEFRQHLLELIMEIKSLTLANQLNSFTIFTGYQSLQRVKMKDPLSIEKSLTLEHAEYLPWAECLMDFNVKVDKVFARGLDKQLLQEEIADFPELFYLSPDTLEPAEEDLQDKREEHNIETHWATINYILLRAEALYRFKWESCSNAEKLALLNLDKQHRLNPSNTQMIEHLAMNGLVKVKQGRLEIINSSFAHFIRNAETANTVNCLVNQSEAGFWKDYQLPLGLLMILIIGGIALTSGESIYIIAASVAGVIGTIASVASSAKMLGGQLK